MDKLTIVLIVVAVLFVVFLLTFLFAALRLAGLEEQKKEIHERKHEIITPDRCVCCGEIIPEGRMICVRCEHQIEE